MMSKALSFLFSSFAFLILASCQTLNQPVIVEPDATINIVQRSAAREPVTILISIDGFRPDYLERGITPNLNQLAQSGTHGPMRPAFPTKTFPNHFTLVTGLRPDNHGIVGNRIFDPVRPDEIFTMANKDPFWWSEGEPIWITAEKQNIRTATMFWPGSEVAFDNLRPSDWWPFNQDLSDNRRVDAVVDWMRRPSGTRPRLVTLYFDTVDTAGHFFGPGPSENLHEVISKVDTQIGRLTQALADMNQPANLVIISDHGMVETNPDQIILLDKIMPRDQYRLIESGNYAGIEPIDGNDDAVRAAFLKPHDNMDCWTRDKIPAHFQYGSNSRVPSIFCLPKTGWVVYQDVPPWFTGIGGGHGYDHRAPEMTALFIAHGPNIKAIADTLPIFDNVHIYSLIAKLTGIRPEQNDGNLTPFNDILRH